MTDVSCYTRMESEIDDIDFVECRDKRELLSKADIDMFDGFNIFKVQGSYANLVDAHKQPGLIQTIGLYLNIDCADTTDEQSAKFGHNMGKFHADAIASLHRTSGNKGRVFLLQLPRVKFEEMAQALVSQRHHWHLATSAHEQDSIT